MTPAALLLFTALKFVTPLDGTQTIGPQWLEVTTDATDVDRIDFTIDGVLAGVARKAPWKIAHDFGTSMASHTVTAKLWRNNYKTTETATVRTAAMTGGEMLNVDLVEVLMRVRSDTQVRAKDLKLRENGVAQTIRDVKTERGPAHFAFVVDRSLSMGEGRLLAALKAIDDEMHLLRPDDTASIVLFNHNVDRVHPIARGEKVADKFGEVVPSGGTSLYDALSSIISDDRTYAIVITDGGDRNSELSSDTALKRISNTHTVVDAIVLGDGSRFLDRAASNTGGEVVSAKRETIDEKLHDLITDINSRYLLIYQSHGTKRGWRSIDIKPSARGVSIMNARKGYFAE